MPDRKPPVPPSTSDVPTRRSLLQTATALPLLAGVAEAAAPPAAKAVKPAPPAITPHAPYLDKTLSVDELDNLWLGKKYELREWPYPVDLKPARWVWIPGERTLPNTFVLFRKNFSLDDLPQSANAWIAADSRYRLSINGQRLQWGPAPCDPRTLDVDPIDLKPFLKPGENVIGIEVLYYGIGEGTWAGGKPGMLFCATLDFGSRVARIASDETWQCLLDRAHQPGRPKRWFLRTLQEQFDARIQPPGWDRANFKADNRWRPAHLIPCPSDKPAACRSDRHYAGDSVDQIDPAAASLRTRQIAAAHETIVAPLGLANAYSVSWSRPTDDWFENRMPDCFTVIGAPTVQANSDGTITIEPVSAQYGVALTFEFAEQLVGWPRFSIEAPEGTTIEVMVQEAHDPTKARWLDSHFFAWSRFVCREGKNEFETFDYESFRWMQLHIRGSSQPFRIYGVGARRRQFAWPQPPQILIDDPALQRLMTASINTLNNCAVETIVDGVGRERQQYSGDLGHALHAIRYTFGANSICRRFLRTYSEGSTIEGYFFDSWPGYDRLARLGQKQMQAAAWGPILDHSVGFVFDNWHHYWETGDKEALMESYPRLLRFEQYLHTVVDADGLLPVENLGLPIVWMDHLAYLLQKHKRCAYNLYAVAMLRHALAPMCELFADPARAASVRRFADQLLAAATRQFWDPALGRFVDNKPWLAQEKTPRFSDRTLATAVLYDLQPVAQYGPSLKALAELPADLGVSYPANQGWRFWALGKGGRADIITQELRSRWALMPSVIKNNTLSEFWDPQPDSTNEWSHCPVAPLYIFFMELLGLRATAPGFGRLRFRPQLDGLPAFDATAHTVKGPIRVQATLDQQDHLITAHFPDGIAVELECAPNHEIDLQGRTLTAGMRVPLTAAHLEGLRLRKKR